MYERMVCKISKVSKNELNEVKCSFIKKLVALNGLTETLNRTKFPITPPYETVLLRDYVQC